MIAFENMDERLKAISKDRNWLAEVSGKKPDTIRGALAPNAPLFKRSESLQKALSEAIEREETSQAVPAVVFESHQLVLRPSDEDYNRWNDAANLANKRVTDWVVDTLNMIGAEKANHSPPIAGNLESLPTPRKTRAKKGA